MLNDCYTETNNHRFEGIHLKDIHVLNTLEEIKIVSDPIRLEIIMNLGDQPKTAQDLSELMKMSRPKLHYHLNILEDKGIIEVVDTEQINGITQKYYLPVARALVPNTELFNRGVKENMYNFEINGEHCDDFEEELRQLIQKYQVDHSDHPNYQVHIYKLDK